MTDSRDQPNQETLSYKSPKPLKRGFMGLNANVIKPETRVNKTEDAEEQPQIRTGNCPNCGNPQRKDRRGWPIQYCGKPCPPLKAEQPNQDLMIITEIEGLVSQVNEKLERLHEPTYDKKTYNLISQALEEIDLFQKTTLFELRKAFE